MSATTDRPITMAGATADLTEAERKHAALIDRLGRNADGITPAMLRDSESAIVFARARVTAAGRSEATRASREAEAALPALAARLGLADEKKLERAWMRLRAALDDCTRAVAEHNAIVAGVEAELRPLLPHLPEGAAQLGGSAWVGGIRIGDVIAARQSPPALGGAFFPVTPPPRPRPVELPSGCPSPLSAGYNGRHFREERKDKRGRPTGEFYCVHCEQARP